MILGQGGISAEFHEAMICFVASGISNVFSKKNNKSVRQTIEHPRYQHLASICSSIYADSLDRPLGEFVLALKQGDDSFYRRFLNKYGDLTYCEFRLNDKSVREKKGLYAYTVGTQLKYLGRCRDSLKKRIDQGYGKIHPKNCYIDGQSTNCHKNALIASCMDELKFHVAEMYDDAEIARLEALLIAEYNPPWNVQLGSGSFSRVKISER